MSKTNTPAELFSSLASRLLVLWRLKLAMLVGLTVGFCVPYIYLAHHAFFPVRQLPVSIADRWATFDPRWVWVYQSIYLLTATLPWLANSREQLRRYLLGFTFLVVPCFVSYLLLPTRVPRPAVSGGGGMYSLLLYYDGPYNAFPSLHAGLLYFTLAFARRVWGRVPTIISVTLIGWALLILWSTLKTKEHYFVDLIAGVALAVFCDWAAWSRTCRSSGDTSHAGSR